MKRLTLVTLLLLFSSLSIGSSIPVDLSDPVYSFISRMETGGIIDCTNSSLPYSRDQIADFLVHIEKKIDLLCRVDKERFYEFYVNYRYEISNDNHGDLNSSEDLLAPFFSESGSIRILTNHLSREKNREESHLFTYEDNDFFLWGDVGLGLHKQSKNGHSRGLLFDQYRVRGSLGKNLSYNVKFFRYSREYNSKYTELTKEEIGNWSMTQPESNITFDNVHSSFVYNKKHFRIGMYHQPIKWGVNSRDNLILSDYGAAFPYFGFDYNYKGINFSFIHGSLLNDSTSVRSADFEVRNREKYIAAHRLEIPLLSHKIRLGITEMLIYGDRNPEAGYMMPMNFFWSIEHTLMDRDNSLLAFDIKINLIRNLRLYGTFLLDELRFGELGNDWWANKHGLQGGFQYSSQLAGFPLDFIVEYTQVRPWTYSHKFLTTNYTNNGISLGFPYGGNSQYFLFRNELWLSSRMKIFTQYTYLKHGYDDMENFWGGNPAIMYTKRDQQFDNSTKWLMGTINNIKTIDINLDYEFMNDCFVVFHLLQQTNHNETNYFFDIGLKLDL